MKIIPFRRDMRETVAALKQLIDDAENGKLVTFCGVAVVDDDRILTYTSSVEQVGLVTFIGLANVLHASLLEDIYDAY